MIGIGQKNSEKIAKQMMILCLKQHLQPKSLYIQVARWGISTGIFFCPWTHKKMPSKHTFRPLGNFQHCQLAQNSPTSPILLHRNGLLRDFYIMTLLAVYLALTLHDDIQKINKYVAVWLKNSMAVSENPNKDILCITTTWYKPDVLIGLSLF